MGHQQCMKGHNIANTLVGHMLHLYPAEQHLQSLNRSALGSGHVKVTNGPDLTRIHLRAWAAPAGSPHA